MVEAYGVIKSIFFIILSASEILLYYILVKGNNKVIKNYMFGVIQSDREEQGKYNCERKLGLSDDHDLTG